MEKIKNIIDILKEGLPTADDSTSFNSFWPK